jgi:glycosyltransferase involved in cell wall biosynthesis
VLYQVINSATTVVNSPCYALIVARDEQSRVGSVVTYALAQIPALVIDDASADDTCREALLSGVPVLIRPSTRGKGSALAAGLALLRTWGAGCVICLDGDGQHDPSFIPEFFRKQKLGYSIVLGNRLHDKRYMPFPRIISNTLTSLVMSLFTRQLIRDSQCGYRLLCCNAMALSPSDPGFMYESEQLFLAARAGLKVGYVDVSTIYRDRAIMRFHVLKDVADFLRIFIRELKSKLG